ncbi:hypothetical protein WJX72_007291 [[Myrmecia] bisecta]|uniref:Uncharacterized protein n=1 Tax=[Myrmecia] bisecta TaxID=41462 RepID=A0AAW1PP78_9CHLO
MPATSKYDFEDVDQEAEAKALGKKLLQAGRPKDALVKLLKQAGELLEHALQTSSSLRHAAADLANALVQKHVLDHKDKDVKICAAFCLSHILRIHAPDSPYNNSQLEDIFNLLLWVFRKLENPASPSFTMCLSVLDLVSQVKCCLLMLDFDSDDMVCDMVRVLLDTINQENAESVEGPMLELISCMLDEGDDVSQTLLDILLDHLIPPKREDNPAAYRLVQQVMQRTEEHLQPHLQKFLTRVILGQPTESELRDDYHKLIYQVYQICPQTLLPVLPHLMLELQVDEEAKRLAAIDLLGKLFTLPEADLDTEYAELFKEFLRRFTDQKAEVRLRVLSFVKDLLTSCSSGTSRSEVLSAVVDRLMDFDDKVRSAAVAAICEAACHDLRLVTLKALEAVAVRLRDKKASVRKDTAVHLMAVYRAYCTKSHEGMVISGDEELVIWIPGRLCHAALPDKELNQHLAESVFKNGIFPVKLPLEAAARHWAALYLESSAPERMALMTLLKARAALQVDVRKFVELRALKTNKDSPSSADVDRAMAASLQRIAASFPEPAKAEDALQKIRDMRDNHIFKALGSLAEPGTSLEAAQKLAKDFVQRVGSRGVVGDTARGLAARLTPVLLSPEQLEVLCEQAVEGAGGEDAKVAGAMLLLLTNAAAAAPQLFASSVEEVLSLVAADDPALLGAAARILAEAGRFMQETLQAADKAKTLKSLRVAMLRLALEGPPPGVWDHKPSKAAVRALGNILPAEDAESALRQLQQRCMTALNVNNHPEKLIAALQSISSIGRQLPNVFAERAQQVTEFVFQQLLPATLDLAPPYNDIDSDMNEDGQVGQVWGHPSCGMHLKLFALKALARACMPDQRQPSKQFPFAILQTVETLVRELTAMLDPADPLDDLRPQGPADLAHAHLAAAAALLRLALAHDSVLPPVTYVQLALIIQDQLMEVRHAFALKVRKTMMHFHRENNGQRAAKYAAILPLAGMDPAEQNRQSAFQSLVDFVTLRRRAAHKHATQAAASRAAGGTMLHEYPDFLLPYMLQILAHHPDLPSQEVLEEEGWEALGPFQRMLQFGLEALMVPEALVDAADSPLPAILRILRTLKNTEDISPEPQSESIYLLCDVGLALAPAILEQQGRANPQALTDKFPGTVPLPTSFYRPLEPQHFKKHKDGGFLPEGFQLALAKPFAKVQKGKRGAGDGGRQAAGRGRGAGRARGAARPRAAGAKPGRKRKADEPRDGGSARKASRRKAEGESEGEESELSESEPEDGASDAEEASEGSGGQPGSAAVSPVRQPKSASKKQPAGKAGKAGKAGSPLSLENDAGEANRRRKRKAAAEGRPEAAAEPEDDGDDGDGESEEEEEEEKPAPKPAAAKRRAANAKPASRPTSRSRNPSRNPTPQTSPIGKAAGEAQAAAKPVEFGSKRARAVAAAAGGQQAPVAPAAKPVEPAPSGRRQQGRGAKMVAQLSLRADTDGEQSSDEGEAAPVSPSRSRKPASSADQISVSAGAAKQAKTKKREAGKR